MIVDFTKLILGLDGKAILEVGETGKEGSKPLTLASIAINSLLSPLPDARGQPEQMDATSKVRFAVLAEKIFKSTGPMDVTVEDVAAIKDRIGRAFGPLPVMRACALLEGEAE